jgi:prepilin-type N-terminal cleavage/methylation domain-containing protein/prepilin-type processing-associated H-X9-DG protein
VRRSAFTLIELLVVIAIISILASILMPVFARAREKGRQAACISNVKQIVLADLMYVQDYDEIFPPGGAPTDAIRWYDAIFPYTHNSQILYCPDRKDSGPGYGMNPLMRMCPIASLWDAASKILCGDVDPALLYPAGSSGNGYPTATIQPTNWWINDPHNTICVAPQDNSFTGNNIPQRHNDGVVYGYADGHAKWGREETMAQAKYWQPAAQ